MKYKIVDIKQRTKEVEGKREIMMRVFFETETGVGGTVDIVKDTFNEKAVREEIERELKVMEKLMG